jgi:putative hydrolase
VSDSGPPDDGGEGGAGRPGDPFGGMPFFGDLARMLGQQGSVSWDTARQLAVSMATEGELEPNVDPTVRIQLEQLMRVAEMQVGAATSLSPSVTGRALTAHAVNRTQWIYESADAWRPLFERLAGSLSRPVGPLPAPRDEADEAAGPFGAWLGQIVQMMSPMMLGMTAGSMLGHLGRRSLGQYDLPLPRPLNDELLVVVPNISEFCEAWSLPRDEVLLWVCLNEATHHAVLGVPHVRQRLDELLAAYADGFRPDASVLEERLERLDLGHAESMTDFQQLLGDPEVLLGALQTPGQVELLPQLEALVAAVTGYVDHVMDRVGGQLIGSYGQLTEALRRRRVEADASDRFVEKLLGLELTQRQYERGEAFAAGVVERAGTDALDRLWADVRYLPTPAEMDAPGLWLARIDLPADDR